MVLLPFDTVQHVQVLLRPSNLWRHAKTLRYPAGQYRHAMLVRILAKQLENRVAGVFLFVVPIFDEGHVRARQINHQDHPERDAAPSGAWSAEGATQNQSQ